MNYSFRTLILLFSIVIVSSCSKETILPENNTITLNGSKFTILSGTILGASTDGIGSTAISLINGTAFNVRTLSIEVNAASEATLEGTYSYPAQDEDGKLDDWLTNYTVFSGTSQSSTNLETGIVTITHESGNTFTIALQLNMVNGDTFEGSYSGNFQVQFTNN